MNEFVVGVISRRQNNKLFETKRKSPQTTWCAFLQKIFFVLFYAKYLQKKKKKKNTIRETQEEKNLNETKQIAINRALTYNNKYHNTNRK